MTLVPLPGWLCSSSRPSIASTRSRSPSSHRHCDRPLLATVVQVALQPAPRSIAGIDDAGPRVAQLFELGPKLGLEPLVLQRQTGCAADRIEQFRSLNDRCVVYEGGHP